LESTQPKGDIDADLLYQNSRRNLSRNTGTGGLRGQRSRNFLGEEKEGAPKKVLSWGHFTRNGAELPPNKAAEERTVGERRGGGITIQGNRSTEKKGEHVIDGYENGEKGIADISRDPMVFVHIAGEVGPMKMHGKGKKKRVDTLRNG